MDFVPSIYVEAANTAFKPFWTAGEIAEIAKARGYFGLPQTRQGVEKYALMSVFAFPGMNRLARWREIVKICSLYRRWRRLAEPMVVLLSSAGWIPPDQIRYG